MMEIVNHILQVNGKPVRFIPSPNHGSKFTPGLPDSEIIHYTAGASAESSIQTLIDPKELKSAHLVVARDGSITQLVPFDTISWHAGESSFNGRSGYNKYSIGIEIDNPGVLHKIGDVFKTWYDKIVGNENVIKALSASGIDTFWYAYTPIQIQTVEEITKALIKTYGIKEILGHEEIAPGRKQDPGPAFPLEKLREILKKKAESQEKQ